MSSLYIMDSNHHLMLVYLQIFSSFCGFSFCWLFFAAETFQFGIVLLGLFLIRLCFGVNSKNQLPRNKIKEFSPFYFCFYSFGLKFKSLIHSELTFDYDIRVHSFFHMWISSFSPPFVEETILSISSYILRAFGRKQINCICVSLFLGSLFCLLDLGIYFMLVPHRFDYYSYIICAEIRK